MKFELNLKDGKLCLDLGDLFYMAYEAQPDEFDQLEFIKKFAWMPQVREEIIKVLKEDYSRPSYCEEVHKEREKFLAAMRDEEIKFYASLIVEKVEDKIRWDREYWKLYHVVREYVTDGVKIPEMEKINFDYRKELEQVIIEAFKKNLPKQGNDEPDKN